MSDTASIAQSLGVDEETVEAILRLGAAQDGPDGRPDSIEGFVSCINQGCERFNEDRPVTLNVERVVQTYKDLGGNLAFVDRDTEHTSLTDDGDLYCPGCGEPCAIIPGKRRVIPNHSRSLVR